MNNDFYEQDFEEILKNLTPDVRSYLDKETEYILYHQSAEKNLLETGCGSGRLMRNIAPYFREVVGIDNHAVQIRSAQEKLRGIRNIELYLMDGLSMDFEDDSFDISCCVFSTLGSFAEKKVDLVREMSRVTKQDGNLFFGVYSENAAGMQIECYRKVGYSHLVGVTTDYVHVRNDDGVDLISERFSRDKLYKIFEGAGLYPQIIELTENAYMCNTINNKKIKNER